MTIDDFTKITAAVGAFLQTIAWPLVVLWLIHKFSPLIREFLANMTEGSLKAFGVEATAKRNAAIEIAKADLIKSPPTSNKTEIASQAANSIRSAEAVTNDIELRRVVGKAVLWVDDQPEDTFYERNALVQLGMRMDIATTADDAVMLFKRMSYDVVVIVPPHILPASKALIDAILARGIPYVLYGKADEREPVSVAASRGAIAMVSRASELTSAVARHLGRMTGSDAMQSYVSWTEHLDALRKIVKD